MKLTRRLFNKLFVGAAVAASAARLPAEIGDRWPEDVREGAIGKEGDPGVEGVDGENGIGYEYVFARSDGRQPPPPSNEWSYDQPELPWRDTPPNLTEDEPVLYRAQHEVRWVGPDWFNIRAKSDWSPPRAIGRMR